MPPFSFKRPIWFSLIGHFVCILIILVAPKISFRKPQTKVMWVELPRGLSEEIDLNLKEAQGLPKTTIQEQKEATKEDKALKTTRAPDPKLTQKSKLRPIQKEKPKVKRRPTEIERALAKLDQRKAAPPEAAQVKDKGEGFKYGTGTEPIRVPPTDPEYIVYQAKVRAKIMQEWIVPLAYLEGAGSPRGRLVVMINDKGEIVSIEWEATSGNSAFDSSCQRAVQRASPLPIPPERLQWEAYNEGFTVEFDPKLKAQ